MSVICSTQMFLYDTIWAGTVHNNHKWKYVDFPALFSSADKDVILYLRWLMHDKSTKLYILLPIIQLFVFFCNLFEMFRATNTFTCNINLYWQSFKMRFVKIKPQIHVKAQEILNLTQTIKNNLLISTCKSFFLVEQQ